MKKLTLVVCLLTAFASAVPAQTDPGPRNTPSAEARPLRGMSTSELAAFLKGLDTFNEVDAVQNGLGPRFNLDSCGGCHAYPSAGGSSPASNPQISLATAAGAMNTVPPFLKSDGPIRVVRFRRGPDGRPDGGVHNLFVISGRGDAPAACQIQQPDFSQIQNLAFRIPTPVFGLGLVETIPDAVLRSSLAANSDQKRQLGIQGRFNTSANDGTITRFGWKAQNKSLTIFAGEAYNVEIGVTNELFPQSREDDPSCLTASSPEDHTNLDTGAPSDVQAFSYFMRYLAPPLPADSNPSVERGRALFDSTGCAMCHTPVLRTAPSSSPALGNQDVHLYSDLAIHRMGPALDDGITQGQAQGQDWRTAPLWGLGDRLFLLHDGRTSDLLQAIRLHDSPGSEAHNVIVNFGGLTDDQKQDLLNFLRSL